MRRPFLFPLLAYMAMTCCGAVEYTAENAALDGSAWVVSASALSRGAPLSGTMGGPGVVIFIEGGHLYCNKLSQIGVDKVSLSMGGSGVKDGLMVTHGSGRAVVPADKGSVFVSISVVSTGELRSLDISREAVDGKRAALFTYSAQ